MGFVPFSIAQADKTTEWLLLYAMQGDLLKVKSLLEQGVDVNAKAKIEGIELTALIVASKEGNLEIVKYLISKGANVNDKVIAGEIGGFTALMSASAAGHTEIVKYLILKGADINAKADNGRTALIIASQKGYLEVVKALAEGKGGFFKKGADINAKGNNGKTALINAVFEGHLDVAKYLISKGADMNTTIELNATTMNILDLAEVYEKYDIAEFLHKKGAKALLSKAEQQQAQIYMQVATAREEMANAMKAIVAKVFKDNINTKAPKAPDPNKPFVFIPTMEWGEWIMQVSKIPRDRYIPANNGIYIMSHKQAITKETKNVTVCGYGDMPLLWINPKTGAMHFNPSKMSSNLKRDDFCGELRYSYTKEDGSSYDKIIPLAPIPNEVNF